MLFKLKEHLLKVVIAVSKLKNSVCIKQIFNFLHNKITKILPTWENCSNPTYKNQLFHNKSTKQCKMKTFRKILSSDITYISINSCFLKNINNS